MAGLLPASDVYAAARYWISNTSANWNDTNNWSASSGGAGGASVPGSSDDVTFDGGTGGTTADGTCVINAAVNVASITATSAYGGTFDNATNDQSVAISGNATFDNTRLDMGDGTWTVSGNWDHADVTTFNRDAATLVMDGSSKTVNMNSKGVHNFTVNGTVSFTVAAGVNGTLTINNGGTLTCSNDIALAAATSDAMIKNGGTITGSGNLVMQSSSSISEMAGTFTSGLTVYDSHTGGAANTLIAGTYGATTSTVTFINSGASNYVQTLLSGTYVFPGNVVFQTSGAGTLEIANSTNNPNVTFQKNVTWTESGAITWTKGSGTVTFSAGSGTNTLDFDGETIEDVVVNAAGVVKQLSDNMTTDTLTITAGTFDLNSKTFALTSTAALSNSGTLLLNGDESISNMTGDTDSGQVTYDGAVTATAANINPYFNVTFNNASGSWTLPAVTGDVNGAFAITAGTVNSNGQNMTVAGNWTNAGTYTSGSNTVTFDGTTSTTVITGGTGTGSDFNNVTVNKTSGADANDDFIISTNDLDIDGTLTLTDGEFDMNGRSVTLSGNLAVGASGSWTSGAGTLTFNSGAAQTLTNAAAASTNLGPVATSTASTVLRVSDSVTFGAVAIAASTSINLNSDQAGTQTTKTDSITNDGTLTMTGSTGGQTLVITNGSTLANSGTIQLVGSSSNLKIQADTGGTVTLTGSDIDYNNQDLTYGAGGGTLILFHDVLVDGVDEDITVDDGVVLMVSFAMSTSASNSLTVTASCSMASAGDFLINTGTITNSGSIGLVMTFDATTDWRGNGQNFGLFYLDDANDDAGAVTLLDNATTGAFYILDGDFVQSTSGTPTLTASGGANVYAGSTWTNNGAGDLVLGGDVANDGVISFNCSDGADGISITSSSSPTQRNWQGAGTFSFTDVTVQDQGAVGGSPAQIYAYSSTNVSGNSNWIFPNFTQNDWRWYADSDNENVTDPWGNPDISENSAINVTPTTLQPPASGTELRLRLNITTSAAIPASFKTLKLQYGSADACTSVSSWTDVGAAGGGSIWRYAASSVSDQAALSASKLASTDIRASYAKSSPSIANPNSATTGQDTEWDFHIQNNGASTATNYCFRAITAADSAAFDGYNADGYPRLTTKADTANQMRHGGVFVSGTEQGYTFTD